MATTDRPDDGETHAQRLARAEFVELRVAPSVEALVATRLLTESLEARGIPFKARMATRVEPGTTDVVPIGIPGGPAHGLPAGDAVGSAVAIVASLGDTPDGQTVAVGDVLAITHDETESYGLGLVGDDLAEGLAHSTLVHGPFSGEPDETSAFVDAHGDDLTGLTSAITLETLAERPPRTAEAIQRLLAGVPTPDGPCRTAAGTADVLDVLVEVDPGLALAMMLGHAGVRASALDAWRTAAIETHEACREADLPADPVAIVETSVRAPGVLARLLYDFRRAEPVIVDAGQHGVAVAGADETMREPLLAFEGAIPTADGRVRLPGGIDVDALAATMEEGSP